MTSKLARYTPILQLAKKCNSPWKMQAELFRWNYNRKDTLYSARTAILKQSAHCMEAALASAAVLELHGYPPIIMSFESQDRLDHIVHIFREFKTYGRYGSIGRSRDEGLHGRAPIFKSLKALAASYCDPYVDSTGRITAYECFHLDEQSTDWRLSSSNIWPTEAFLLNAKHQPLNISDSRYRRLLKAYKAHGPMGRESSWWSPPRA